MKTERKLTMAISPSFKDALLMDDIRTEVLRLRRTTKPNIGWVVKQARYKAVDVVFDARGRSTVTDLTEWMTLTQLRSWMRKQK